jgi:catalase
MVLDRNPANYFNDVEQVAFSPGNLVPGVAPSPDKMLQGRLFAYHDAHRYRLGANYQQLPVNAPKGMVTNYQRDGFMRRDSGFEGAPNYYPNTFGGPEPDPSVKWPSVDVSGNVGRHAYSHPNSDFVQPRTLYERVMTDVDRDHLIGNIVDHLSGAKKEIQLRQTVLFYKVQEEYGTRVAEGLGLDVVEVKRLAET